MTQPGLRLVTFEEYLDYDNGTDKSYELTNEELTEVPHSKFERRGGDSNPR